MLAELRRLINRTRETGVETMDTDSETIISNIPSTRKERNYLPKYLCLVVLSWHLPLLLSGGQKALDWQSWSEGNTFHFKHKKTDLQLESVVNQSTLKLCVMQSSNTSRHRKSETFDTFDEIWDDAEDITESCLRLDETNSNYFLTFNYDRVVSGSEDSSSNILR